MSKERQQIVRFIEDSRNAGCDSVTYEMYENWCSNNNEQPIPSGRFNAIILTSFGFSWNKEKGYNIK